MCSTPSGALQHGPLPRPEAAIKPHPLLTRKENLRWCTACLPTWYPTPFLTLTFRVQWHPTPVLLPGKFHGRRSLVGCSSWGRAELDATERLHFHFSFSCIGEGNGNPLQCSCLENPRDNGAWWAAVYGVAQSRTRLKRLSSRAIQLLIETVIYDTNNKYVEDHKQQHLKQSL